jgi:hypothetical protein
MSTYRSSDSTSAFSTSAFSTSAFSTSAFSGSAFSASAFSASAFSASAFSASAFSASAFSASAYLRLLDFRLLDFRLLGLRLLGKGGGCLARGRLVPVRDACGRGDRSRTGKRGRALRITAHDLHPHPLLALRQVAAEPLAGDRGSVDEALDLVAPHLAQQRHLLLGVDALCDDLEVEAVRHRDHRPGDPRGRRIGVDVADEAPIHLQDVERKAPQVAERRVAGAEVVERNAHTDGPQVPQACRGVLVVRQQRALGELDLEQVRTQVVVAKALGQRRVDVGPGQLDAGHVDRDGHGIVARVQPTADLSAGGIDHPRPDGDDQPRVLGDRDELLGSHGSQLRALPAQQRLGADDLPLGDVDLGLIVELELVVLDRAAQVAFDERLPLGADDHVLGKELMRAAVLTLGVVERDVRVLGQRLHVVAVLRVDRDADAARGAHRLAGQLHALRGQLEDALCDPARILRREDLRYQECKLVAAEASHVRARALLIRGALPASEALAQPLGEDPEQLVAGGVAERIVDLLEAVEVHVEEGESVALLLRGRHRLGELVHEEAPVSQPGQAVEVGAVSEVAFGLPPRRDVLDGDDASVPGAAVQARDADLVATARAGRSTGEEFPAAPGRILDQREQIRVISQ